MALGARQAPGPARPEPAPALASARSFFALAADPDATSLATLAGFGDAEQRAVDASARVAAERWAREQVASGEWLFGAALDEELERAGREARAALVVDDVPADDEPELPPPPPAVPEAPPEMLRRWQEGVMG